MRPWHLQHQVFIVYSVILLPCCYWSVMSSNDVKHQSFPLQVRQILLPFHVHPTYNYQTKLINVQKNPTTVSLNFSYQSLITLFQTFSGIPSPLIIKRHPHHLILLNSNLFSNALSLNSTFLLIQIFSDFSYKEVWVVLSHPRLSYNPNTTFCILPKDTASNRTHYFAE